jgi:hypothetical protein
VTSRQFKPENEKNAEGAVEDQFAPAEGTNIERFRLPGEPCETAGQHRQERNSCVPTEQVSGAGGNQKDHQNYLTGKEPAADGELLIRLCRVRSPDTELYEQDLVDGEQKVGDPKRLGDVIPVARNDAVCRGRNQRQPRRAHHLGRRPGASTSPFYDSLSDECGRRSSANPQ